jgi:amphi-Trp domain-containing protein
MPPRPKVFEHESLQDGASLAAYLEAIRAGIEAGSLELASNGNQLNLKPNGLIHLQLRARQDQDRAALTLELNWRQATDDAPGDGERLTIGTSGGTGDDAGAASE